MTAVTGALLTFKRPKLSSTSGQTIHGSGIADSGTQEPHGTDRWLPEGGGAERDSFHHPSTFSQLALMWIQMLSLRIKNFSLTRMAGICF